MKVAQEIFLNEGHANKDLRMSEVSDLLAVSGNPKPWIGVTQSLGTLCVKTPMSA